MNEKISAEYPFESNYVEVLGSKMHYVDQGRGAPILFLHGNPTSSYLWRNIIPHLAPLGRCLAPDLIGMGKSDKPDLDYRLKDHIPYIDGFIEALGLEDLTLVIHDWGSAIGFDYARRHEANVRGLAFMEAILAPASNWDVFPEDMAGIFKSFRTPDLGWKLIVDKNMFVENVLPASVIRKLTTEEMDQYRGPFADPADRKPVWRWPNEIPIEGHPADVVELVGAYNQWLQQTPLPKLLLYADPGALIRPPLVRWCRDHLKNLETIDLGPGVHFLQEDHPHRIGAALAEWYGRLEKGNE